MTSLYDDAADELRGYGLTFPGAHLKSPWPEHNDLAVNDKAFAHLSTPGGPCSISCKLPLTGGEALAFEFATPPARYHRVRHGTGGYGAARHIQAGHRARMHKGLGVPSR